MDDKPRILLIRPYRNKSGKTLMPPLGIMQLAAYLRRRGDLDIKIIDMAPAGIAYEQIGEEILKYQPAWLGISALTFESGGLHRLAAIAKKVNPDLPVVAGGAHPSAYTEQVMADAHIDYAVIGEGELTIETLDRAIRARGAVNQIDGLAWRENGSIRINPRRHYIEDLDAMPFAAWDLIDIPRYRDFDRMSRCGNIRNYMPVFTSRACPFQCIYCHQLFGKSFRARSPENVLAEIRELYEKHNVCEFEIVDDIFNCDLPRAKRIFDLIAESGMKIRFTLPNGIRGDHVDEEFFIKARRAGLVFVAFAVETAVPRLQKMIRKNIDLQKIRQSISLARKYRILCQGLFMLGFPTETREELKATVDFAVNSDLHAAHLFIVNPYEGTELAKLAEEMGKPIFHQFDNNYLTSGFDNLTDLPDAELNRIRRFGLIRFWLRPSRIWAIIRDYPDKSQLPSLVKVLINRLLLRE
jgi:radical SAM superfamily enzyme YgiQ (UPF0313 family)